MIGIVPTGIFYLYVVHYAILAHNVDGYTSMADLPPGFRVVPYDGAKHRQVPEPTLAIVVELTARVLSPGIQKTPP
jgi:hypothetical protein